MTGLVHFLGLKLIGLDPAQIAKVVRKVEVEWD